jgi:hypothetical protein
MLLRMLSLKMGGVLRHANVGADASRDGVVDIGLVAEVAEIGGGKDIDKCTGKDTDKRTDGNARNSRAGVCVDESSPWSSVEGRRSGPGVIELWVPGSVEGSVRLLQTSLDRRIATALEFLSHMHRDPNHHFTIAAQRVILGK